MIQKTFIAVAILFSAPAQGASPVQPSPVRIEPRFLDAFQLRMLDLHNDQRTAVNAPPLQWDNALETAARDYAKLLALRQDFNHSPRKTRPGQSENLWRGTGGAYKVETMIGYWAEERSGFVPGIFPNISASRNWLDVSHYTQMIWPETTHVGCHMQRSFPNDYLVCRYSPAGNRDGRRLP